MKFSCHRLSPSSAHRKCLHLDDFGHHHIWSQETQETEEFSVKSWSDSKGAPTLGYETHTLLWPIPTGSSLGLVQLLPALSVRSELLLLPISRSWRGWMLLVGFVGKFLGGGQACCYLLARSGSLRSSALSRLVPLLQLPVQINHVFLQHCKMRRWQFFNTCSSSQATKAVSRSHFKFTQSTFHSSSGNSNWFAATQRKRADSSCSCAQSSAQGSVQQLPSLLNKRWKSIPVLDKGSLLKALLEGICAVTKLNK